MAPSLSWLAHSALVKQEMGGERAWIQIFSCQTHQQTSSCSCFQYWGVQEESFCCMKDIFKAFFLGH